MNQERVKELLESIKESPAPFTLLFSGKTNNKVNGLYKPDKAEILLHNKNFESDNQLLYTAFHEYAHHLHHCARGGISTSRPHTQEFWAIFHDLVKAAEEKGIYTNIFEAEPDFVDLTKRIKETCIRANGEIMLEFGRLLAEASDLCKTHRARFEDYVERILGVPRRTAESAVAAQSYGLDASLGWDGLRFAASIRDPGERMKAISAMEAGASPTSVKGLLKSGIESDDPIDRLLQEKARIERTISSLTSRLEEIEEKLALSNS
jgi:hypothetical protein